MRGSCRSRTEVSGRKTYYYRFRDPSQQGRQVSSAIDPATNRTFTSKKRCEDVLTAELARRSAPDYFQPSMELLADYLPRWLRDTDHTRSEGSTYTHTTVIRARILPRLGDVPLGRLDALTMQDFYRDLLADGYAPKTVRYTHTILSAALKCAVRWRLLRENPCDLTSLPTQRTERRAVWTSEQVTAFLAATKDDPHYALWRFLLDSWCRISEALALTWGDLEDGAVLVSKTVSRTKEGAMMVADRPKTDAGYRTIHLRPETLAALKRYRTEQIERRLACRRWHEGNIIFDRRDGGIPQNFIINRWLTAACVQANLPRLTAHELRHTGATLAAASGMPLNAIKDRLGHASIAMTADLYAHPSAEADKKIVDGSVWMEG